MRMHDQNRTSLHDAGFREEGKWGSSLLDMVTVRVTCTQSPPFVMTLHVTYAQTPTCLGHSSTGIRNTASCGRRVLLVVVGVLGTGRWGDRERCMCRVDLELLGNAGLGS